MVLGTMPKRPRAGWSILLTLEQIFCQTAGRGRYGMNQLDDGRLVV